NAAPIGHGVGGNHPGRNCRAAVSIACHTQTTGLAPVHTTMPGCPAWFRCHISRMPGCDFDSFGSWAKLRTRFESLSPQGCGNPVARLGFLAAPVLERP